MWVRITFLIYIYIYDSFHVITGRISTLQGGQEFLDCRCESFYSSCLCPKFMEPYITEEWNMNESLGTFTRQKSSKLSWRFSSRLLSPIIHNSQTLFGQCSFLKVDVCHFCCDLFVMQTSTFFGFQALTSQAHLPRCFLPYTNPSGPLVSVDFMSPLRKYSVESPRLHVKDGFMLRNGFIRSRLERPRKK